MKLLLTSAGIKNKSIQDALAELLGKPISEASALCIPTAMYGHPWAGPGVKAWEFISGREPNCPMCELGWKSLGVLELTALPSIDEERWVPLVQETDVLLGSGGDALYLCHWMRQSGLADLLPSLDETVWVGLSAGSMVMTPRIGEDFVQWKPPTGGDETLGLVEFSICPHLAHGGDGRQGSRFRRMRSTTRPPSKWSTAPSKSSPRGTGNCSRPRTETCARVLSPEPRRSERVCVLPCPKDAERDGAFMEPSGRNRWQSVANAPNRERPKQAKTVAVGCDRLPGPQNDKEEVDRSALREAELERRCRSWHRVDHTPTTQAVPVVAGHSRFARPGKPCCSQEFRVVAGCSRLRRTGLSRRRSRVRVPSLPSQKSCK